jgi:Holliday junction resolvasome RuvABC endonuclease subunit
MTADLKILALDTATVTGWATNACGGLESGTQRFDLRRGSSPGFRFMEFRQWLEGMLNKLDPELLVYEQAHHRGGAATELCVGFTTRVMEIAAARGIEYRAVHSGTLKRWATGNGSAGKPEMIRAACVSWTADKPEGVTDDNEADSMLLLAFALAGFPELAAARRPGGRGERNTP